MLSPLGFFLARLCQRLGVDFTLVHVYVSYDVAADECLAARCEVRDGLVSCLASSGRDRLEQADVVEVEVELFVDLLQVAFDLHSVLQLDDYSYWELLALLSKRLEERPK